MQGRSVGVGVGGFWVANTCADDVFETVGIGVGLSGVLVAVGEDIEFAFVAAFAFIFVFGFKFEIIASFVLIFSLFAF